MQIRGQSEDESEEIFQIPASSFNIPYILINNKQMQGGVFIALQKKLLSLIDSGKETRCSQSQQCSVKDKKDINNSLTLSYMVIQKLPLSTKKIFQQHYQNLIELTINNCDLRTFENFPKLKIIRKLNVSKNSLRGSFQFVVKNRTLKYLDVSHNLIADIKRFEPLRIIKDISLYAKFNPFDSKNRQESSSHSKTSVVEQMKGLGIKYLDKPLNDQANVKKQQKQKYSKSASIPSPVLNKKKSSVVEAQRQKRNQHSYHQQILQIDHNLSERIVRRQAMMNARNQPQPKPSTIINPLNDLVRPVEQGIGDLPNYSSSQSEQQQQEINLDVIDQFSGLNEQHDQNDDEQDDQQLELNEMGLFNVLRFSDRDPDLFNGGLRITRIDGDLQSEDNEEEDDDDDQDDEILSEQSPDSDQLSQDNF